MNYRKGANAERELLHKLFEKNYAVFRIAGSGSTSLPAVDLLAVKKGKGYLIECKAWAGKRLSIKNSQIQELQTLQQRTDFEIIIAWKADYKGWFFFHIDDMTQTETNFNISLDKAKTSSFSLL